MNSTEMLLNAILLASISQRQVLKNVWLRYILWK